MARTMSWLLGLAVVIIAVLAWLLCREHADAIEMTSELARLKLSAAPTNAQRGRTAANPGSRAETASTAAAPVAEPVPTPPAPPRVYSNSELRARAQLTEYRRWMTLSKQAALLDALNLPPDKIVSFKNLLVDRDDAERDAREAAKTVGADPNAAIANETGKIDERIRALLDGADYARYAEFKATEQFRSMLDANPLVGCLVDAASPLNNAQKDWLAGIMARTTPGGAPAPDQTQDPTAPLAAFHAAVLAEAPERLTPAQAAAMQEFFRKDDELARNLRAMRPRPAPR